MNVEDGLDGVHDSHEGDHDAEDVNARPGHVHHEAVHGHRLARPQSDLHCSLFSREGDSARAAVSLSQGR